jgi:4-amino-4-deoxy-L-arabinose transferase-like glycosyltransferase
VAIDIASWRINTELRWLALIFVASLVMRVVWISYVQSVPISDFAGYDRQGWNISEGLGYVTEDGQPTAYWPPGYAAFLGGIYLFFGHSWLAGQIANVLLGSSVVLLTFMIGRLLLPPFQARIATVLVAFSPSLK